MDDEEPTVIDSGYDDFDEFGEADNRDYGMPINKDVHLDNKIISTAAKNKIVIATPKIEKRRVGILVVDKKGNIQTRKVKTSRGVEDVPLVSSVKTMDVLLGFDSIEKDFPVKDWFNDSTTSSILEPDEVRFIRHCDDVAFHLMSKSIQYPERVRALGFIQRLHAIKQSIADSAKGRGGGAIEQAKTTISRSESTSYLYRREREELDARRAREEEVNKGLLGFGVRIPIVGIRL